MPDRDRGRAGARKSPRFVWPTASVAGGVCLLTATFLALAWANSPAAPLYRRLVTWPLGGLGFVLPLQGWVNDGLMSLFFLLAGLEIRREITDGALATARGFAGPCLAALGGMMVPAGVYLALNHADPAARAGWAVPIATDIAFSLTALRVAGGNLAPARLFLTAVAIMDDLGAILVIGFFYASPAHPAALAGAAAVWGGLLALNRAGAARFWIYALGGAVLWGFLARAGVEPALSGVALAFAMPHPKNGALRLEQRLEILVALFVLPVFALMNAGLDLSPLLGGALLHAAPLGVILGLCLGKPAGVFGATWLGQRAGLVALPPALSPSALFGASLLCGIGFTMSLFIGALAFRAGPARDILQTAVLLASALSALLAFVYLRLARPK